MNPPKKARARQTVNFLRTSLRSLIASASTENRLESLVASEVEQELHSILEAYAMGNIQDPHSLLADHALPQEEPSVSIR